jgi:hypothetical protein
MESSARAPGIGQALREIISAYAERDMRRLATELDRWEKSCGALMEAWLVVLNEPARLEYAASPALAAEAIVYSFLVRRWYAELAGAVRSECGKGGEAMGALARGFSAVSNRGIDGLAHAFGLYLHKKGMDNELMELLYDADTPALSAKFWKNAQVLSKTGGTHALSVLASASGVNRDAARALSGFFSSPDGKIRMFALKALAGSEDPVVALNALELASDELDNDAKNHIYGILHKNRAHIGPELEGWLAGADDREVALAVAPMLMRLGEERRLLAAAKKLRERGKADISETIMKIIG